MHPLSMIRWRISTVRCALAQIGRWLNDTRHQMVAVHCRYDDIEYRPYCVRCNTDADMRSIADSVKWGICPILQRLVWYIQLSQRLARAMRWMHVKLIRVNYYHNYFTCQK